MKTIDYIADCGLIFYSYGGHKMAIAKKVLWVVSMNSDADAQSFAQCVNAAGIDTVCIRTTTSRLPDSIGRFHHLGKKVWAWRWPGVDPDPLKAKGLKKEVPKDINGGTPTKAIARGMAAWKPAGMGKSIIPMAGEIDLATVSEIQEFGAQLQALNATEAHFYADLPTVKPEVLAAIKAI